MADGLTFLLELDSKLDGGFAFNKVLKQSEDQLKKLDGGMRAVEKTTGGLIATFKQVAVFEIFRRAVSGAIDLASELAHKVFEIGGEMINAAAKAERTEMSFKLLMGVEGGKETLEWIESISKFTEFTDDELKGIAGGLAKVGFAGEDLTRALAATLDIAAFSGSGAEGAAAAQFSLSQAMRTGKVDNKTLRGLGFGEKDFLAEMSLRTGLGLDTLKKKIDAGKINTSESLEALYSMIAKKTGKDLGGAGVEMSKTMTARLKHLKDLPDQFFQQLAGTQGFAKISDLVGRVVALLDPDSEFGVKVSGALTSIFDTVSNKLAGIPIESIMTRGLAILEQVPMAVMAVTGTVKDLAEAFAPVVSAFEAAGKFAGLFGGDTTKHGSNEEALKYDLPGQLLRQKLKDELILSRAMAAHGQVYQSPDKVFGPQQTGMERLARQYADMGKMAAGGMGKGLQGAVPGVAIASAGMADKAAQSSRDALGQKSPSKVFEQIGMMTGAGFRQGIEKSRAATDDVMRGAFAAPAPTSGGAGGGGTEINLGGIHVTIGAGAGSDARQIGETVAAKIQEIAPGMLQSAIERLALQAGGA